MQRTSIFLAAIFLFVSVEVFAKISLPTLIGSNMVLQQQSEVALWGQAKTNSKISITTSWNKKSHTGKSDEKGAWKIYIQTPEAGGPYEIVLSDGEKLKLSNILIGEVWICSGQSNMEMPVKGFKNQPTLNSSKILLNAGNPQIRLFRLERTASRTPLDDPESAWQASDAENVKEFSAVGYQYAKLLQEKLKVPVGIIQTAWGGTMIEAWMNQHSLKNFPEIKIKAPEDTSKINKNDPTVLFNGMVKPLIGFGIKGVIWYQGEQNRSNAEIYDELMASMVKEWRALWGRGEWPFYYVQIAPYTYKDTRGPASYLREAQLKAMELIPNSGMVVSMDVGNEKNIHPADKTTISQRLACWSLANTYGKKGIPFASPVYRSMEVEGDRVHLTFDHAENGLTSFDKPLSAFEVAGADKVFYPAEAKITGKGVTVWSESVANPVSVRYAFKDWVAGDLFNTEGLPASPFRTDEW
ncbi:MAG TPA: sialate O-acetylesterase [Cytophagales bacterium]|nr:sialate O-acetylesterase [Cytophagales bacterium]